MERVLYANSGLSNSAAKEHESTTTDIINSFESFLTRNNITKGAIAVSYNGELVATAHKNRKATEPARVASLSKAVTAVCLMKALEGSRFSVESTLNDLIPDELRDSPIGSQRYGPITIEQLLNHTSGIRINHFAQIGKLVRRYEQEQKYWQLEKILQSEPGGRRGGSYYYTNANYLILGVLIEKITGLAYESFCTNTLFTPLEITTAKLSPRWRILSSFGGWEISPVDHLRFVDKYFTDDWRSVLPAADSFDPAFKRAGSYGLGVWMKKTYRGVSFSHAGTFTWKSQWNNARFAAFFAAYNSGYSVSVNYSKDARNNRGLELERALNLAAM